MTDAMQMGALIRARREQLGLAQADLGTALGVTRAQISNLERGTSGPSFKLLLGLIRILGFSLFDAFREEVPLAQDDVVGPEERAAVPWAHSGGVRVERMVKPRAGTLEAHEAVFSGPDARMSPPAGAGDQWVHVLEGSVVVQAAGREHTLAEGEGLALAGDEERSLANAEDGESRVVIISVPAAS
jgi:transcriptional regulator with XRE-family HTH domain